MLLLLAKLMLKITDGLAQLIFSVEVIITRIDFVKVDEVSEDVSPQVVWEYLVSWVVDDLRFACFDIEMIVHFEFECEFELWVQWCMSGCEIPPCEE